MASERSAEVSGSSGSPERSTAISWPPRHWSRRHPSRVGRPRPWSPSRSPRR
ncbi:hypothetical protein ACFFX0_22240 [Citricoccus parietis]|uniref:Uncharacterized protein n=1 Tax=Citricoccus parietis TaxID=592307 RepID=A0ABV5G4A7_9MICC